MIVSPKRILIVDDEATVLRSFQKVILGHFPDYVVEVVKNGFDAIEAFSQRRHNLLLMDLNMPVLDGMSAQYEIQTMCENRGWPLPAILFCTGYMPPDEVRDLVKQNPSCALLLKPVAPAALIKEIKQRLGSDEAGETPAS